ncbi:plasmid partitioning protein RepA [Citreicella sp. C3M06]|uniref:plasmid partitioning protein RepA n=1 Tax=Roseobacteraceae TaxID=2854170 RepID=UPI001C084019|nr:MULTISPECIES: plasmid partitioning protein RepA [Roseobacteraceae]MBU2959935.1 plasmid partitioning protein RepA [Citreicella sp. C3M06]MDO6587225.1 plasmid partitioning protein RepA [Salipiger sp. 1_MG-2023]
MNDSDLDLDTAIGQYAELLAANLQAQREAHFPPDARKQMRSLTSGEAAELLHVDHTYLRKLHREGKIPEVEMTAGNHRRYTLDDLWQIREALESKAKKPGTYLPGRRGDDPLQVISVVNFKGGSGKTTTSAHLAQRLALTGYRVLAVDLDPQASLSALHGIQPEVDLADGGTLYDAVRYDAPMPIRDVIRKTYMRGLDLIPGNLELMEFEHETPAAIARGGARAFFARVRDALDEVEADYDVVVIDCPPQLGFLTMSALSASTGVLVTVHPQMLDLMSMSQFLRMTSDLLSVIRDAGADLRFDWLRFLPTRYKVGDAPQTEVIAFIRGLFGRAVLVNQMVESTAISDAGLTKQTLYEAERKDFTRATFDRAIDSMNAVNDEIAALLQKTWGR